MKVRKTWTVGGHIKGGPLDPPLIAMHDWFVKLSKFYKIKFK